MQQHSRAIATRRHTHADTSSNSGFARLTSFLTLTIIPTIQGSLRSRCRTQKIATSWTTPSRPHRTRNSTAKTSWSRPLLSVRSLPTTLSQKARERLLRRKAERSMQTSLSTATPPTMSRRRRKPVRSQPRARLLPRLLFHRPPVLLPRVLPVLPGRPQLPLQQREVPSLVLGPPSRALRLQEQPLPRPQPEQHVQVLQDVLALPVRLQRGLARQPLDRA